MCTVTYIPTKEGYLLTSNRDEQRGRPPAQAPALYNGHTGNLLYPRDTLAGGTWFVTHGRGHTIVLLNGGWERHIPHPPYRMSRGLVLLELADSGDPLQAFADIPLEGIEPFTLVLSNPAGSPDGILSPDSSPSPDGGLYECRWDGREKYCSRMDASLPHIWSSVTLYGPAITARRRSWFQSWVRANPAPDQAAILDFHRFTGDGDPHNDLLMNRDDSLLTVSITSLEFRRAAERPRGRVAAAFTTPPDRSSARMLYTDILSGASARQQLFIDVTIPRIA